MNNVITHFLFEFTDKVEFKTELPLDRAVDRLRRAIGSVDTGPTSRFVGSSLKGEVSQRRVIARRASPLLGNYLMAPIFFGSWRECDGRYILQGVFSVSRVTRVVFAMGGILLLLTELLFVISAMNSPGSIGERLFAILLMPMVAIVVVLVLLLLKALFRNDVRWISRALTDALE